MAEGLTYDLMLAGIIVAVLALPVCCRVLSVRASVLLVTIKVALPIAYFAWFYDGTWNFLDDVTYQKQGERLLAAGYDPWSLLWEAGGLDALENFIGSSHFVYGWWNLFAQYFLGEHYYSPVFLNVLLTFFCAFWFSRIVRTLGFEDRYSRNLFVFFALQPEILAWSSLINLKDILVMTLSVMTFSSVIVLLDRFSLSRLALIALLFSIFTFLRYYTPLLILLAILIHLCMMSRGWARLLLVPIALGAIFYLRPWDSSDLSLIEDNQLFGVVRFLLTPKPWGTEESYSFLALPALLNWLLIIPAIIGTVSLSRISGKGRVLIIFFAICVIFYASVPELQSPRHRVQLLFVLAWLQYHGLCTIMPSRLFPNWKRAGSEAAFSPIPQPGGAF